MTSPATLLILDDNPLVVRLVTALLRRDGFTILGASNWIEFNELLAVHTPDIIFLDVNLPSVKGNRLSEIFKSQSHKRHIPVILVSDLPAHALEEIFPGSGADAWMRKPLTREKMLEMIGRWVPSAANPDTRSP